METYLAAPFRDGRGRTALFVALTLGVAAAAAFVVPAIANGRVKPNLTVAGQTQFVDNTPGDTYAVQGVVGGQNGATAIEGFVTNPAATNDNAIFGYTVAPSGNAVIGIAQPASGTATALVGYAYRGYGVIGQTPYTGAAVAGVLGQDLSGAGWAGNSGVVGATTLGNGVLGSASGNNGWGGSFVGGTGPNGYGVIASAVSANAGNFFSSQVTGLFGSTGRDSTSGGGYAGLYGQDLSTVSTAVNDSGVLGQSNYGFGITGQSGTSGGGFNAGTGISGVTNNNSTSNPHTVFGVQGTDNDPNLGSFDAGVYGTSTNGYGVEGLSSTYYGLLATSNSNVAVFAGSNSNIALFGTSASLVHPALYVTNNGASANTSPVFIAHSGLGGGGGLDVFSVAADGTVIARGTITASGTPLLMTRTTTGTNEVAYGARQSRPTIEDVGESSLVNGAAFVAIDRSFGSTIDQNASYLVFITPQGETKGLYVTGKTRAGFYVREYNGASNIAFDYRIVAKPAFDNSSRLPDVRSVPWLSHALYANTVVPPAKESIAQIMARDRANRAHVAASSVSAAQLAAQRAEAVKNAARQAQVRKMKFPHVPTPAELHVPNATQH